MIPGVLATLRSGLQLISFPPRRIAEFFDELMACHETVLVEARLARESAGISDPSIDVGYTVMDDTALQEDHDEVEDAMPSQAPWLGELEAAEAGYLDAEAVMPLDPSTLDVSGGGPAGGKGRDRSHQRRHVGRVDGGRPMDPAQADLEQSAPYAAHVHFHEWPGTLHVGPVNGQAAGQRHDPYCLGRLDR